MSTEFSGLSNPTREYHRWIDRLGDDLRVRIGGRATDAELVDVEYAFAAVTASIRLRVRTDCGGAFAVPPDAVVG